jgi:hypothetical protein
VKMKRDSFKGWGKSSHSDDMENNCVEVGYAAELVGVCDTKQTFAADADQRTVLAFPRSSFGAFVRSVTH